MPIKHPFVSNIPDGTDTSLVRPSNWNADHSITLTQPELTSILFGALGSGSVGQFLETNGPSSLVAWGTPAGSGGGVSVAGTPLVNQITGWANAATILALSIGNNLSLVNSTLAALAAGISVTGAPSVGQVAAWASGNSLLGVTIGANVSLIGGNTLTATGGGGGISVTGTPTAGQLTAWASGNSLLGVTIGANISLTGGNTISAPSAGGGISVAGTPAAGEITGWNNAATVTSVLLGTGLSLASNILSAPGGVGTGRFLGYQIITTPGAYTFTPIAGTNSVIIELLGGGGGGGGVSVLAGTSLWNIGGGGSGGAWGQVSLNANFSLGTGTIGLGGTGGTSVSNAGTGGGQTSFITTNGVSYVAGGGFAAGTNVRVPVPNGVGTNGGGVVSGAAFDISQAGGYGPAGVALRDTYGFQAAGGTSRYSGGAVGLFLANNQTSIGQDALGIGGGGGGAMSEGTGTGNRGGNGSSGCAIFWMMS